MGAPTWEEMMIGWFNYTVPVSQAVTRASR